MHYDLYKAGYGLSEKIFPLNDSPAVEMLLTPHGICHPCSQAKQPLCHCPAKPIGHLITEVH